MALIGCQPDELSESERAHLIRDAIQVEYAPQPLPEWFGAYREVVVEAGTVYIQSEFTDAHQELAGAMCQDIAAVSFGPNGEALGVTVVRIYSVQNEEMTSCEVPEPPGPRESAEPT